MNCQDFFIWLDEQIKYSGRASFKQNAQIRHGDTENMVVMTDAYVNKLASDSYREAVAKKCRELIEKIIKPADAVKYAVALGKRGFMWDVLIDCVSKNALKVRRYDL